MSSRDVLNNAIDEDIETVSSSEAAWEMSSLTPEIKQIYGHYLPPVHMRKVNGIIAVDFNFPPPYHTANPEDLQFIDDLFTDKKMKINSHFKFRLNKSIRMRADHDGAVIYTSYYNGFYVNSIGYKIIKLLTDDKPIVKVAEMLQMEIDKVIAFVARLLTLGVGHAYSSSS